MNMKRASSYFHYTLLLWDSARDVEKHFINKNVIIAVPADSSDGVGSSPAVNRASSAMWVFGTGLCVMVGVLVIGGVVYQLHLDRMRKTTEEPKQLERSKQITVCVWCFMHCGYTEKLWRLVCANYQKIKMCVRYLKTN